MEGKAMLTISFEAENAAMVEAVKFAGTGSRWLAGLHPNEVDLHGNPVPLDRWIFDAMNVSTSGVGFRERPDPARAVVVMSNGYDSDPDASDYYGWRKWWYASDVEVCVTGVDSATQQFIGDCHRCSTFHLIEHYEPRPIVTVFHIPRGRFAVEFALCLDCASYYRSLANDCDEDHAGGGSGMVR